MSEEKKIFVKDAEKYVELLQQENDIRDYLKTICWCRNNIDQVNSVDLFLDREPQNTDEDWNDELYLTDLKQLIIEKVYDALHEKLAEVENDREDLICHCNNTESEYDNG